MIIAAAFDIKSWIYAKRRKCGVFGAFREEAGDTAVHSAGSSCYHKGDLQ
jgi:hypothetical protein